MQLSEMYRVNEGTPQEPRFLGVQFYEKPIKSEAASVKEGRPIYHTAIMARIMAPGMKNQIVDEQIELLDENKAVIKRKPWVMNPNTGLPIYYTDRFKEAYKAWREGRSLDDGTPLETYTRLDVAQVAMLQQLGIRSLENLASLPDSALSNLGPGGRQMRDEAKNFLEAAKGNAPVAKLVAENDAMKEQLAELQRKFEMLSQGHVPAKRGRKPKVVAENATAA